MNNRRPGFTLIELLVVIAIITFLAGLAVLIGPALLRSEQSSRGAQLLQGNLFIAKQQALRDRAPYGIRLLPDSDGQVRSFQFIQQPGDFVKGSITTVTGSNQVVFTNVDLSGGLGADTTLWPVQVGDYLLIQGFPPVHAITGVNPSTISISPRSPVTTLTTSDYRIIRSPRPAAGEDTIFLPDNVIIDIGRSKIAADETTKKYDILFAPAGSVLGSAANNGKIILWVRDVTQNPATTTEQSLITVFTRTGLIAVFPVDTSSGNPYSFTQDPRAAGGL